MGSGVKAPSSPKSGPPLQKLGSHSRPSRRLAWSHMNHDVGATSPLFCRREYSCPIRGSSRTPWTFNTRLPPAWKILITLLGSYSSFQEPTGQLQEPAFQRRILCSGDMSETWHGSCGPLRGTRRCWWRTMSRGRAHTAQVCLTAFYTGQHHPES